LVEGEAVDTIRAIYFIDGIRQRLRSRVANFSLLQEMAMAPNFIVGRKIHIVLDELPPISSQERKRHAVKFAQHLYLRVTILALSEQANILGIADHRVKKSSDTGPNHDGMEFCGGSHRSHPCHNGWSIL
jgi:hypothetical protein